MAMPNGDLDFSSPVAKQLWLKGKRFKALKLQIIHQQRLYNMYIVLVGCEQGVRVGRMYNIKFKDNGFES